jgi:hypothetical protein
MQTESSIQPTQPLVPHPPDERGVFAPKDSQRQEQTKPQNKSVDKFLTEICQQIDKECDERAEIRARRYTRNYNYWRGGERRFQVWTKQGFQPMDSTKVKRLFSNNQAAYQVRTILSTVTRSHPRLVVSPAPSATDDSEKVSASRVATRTLQHDQREKLSAEFMTRAWMDKLLFGIEIRGQWYAKEGSQAKARVPIFEERQIQGPGAYVCGGCGMTGPDSYAQDGKCPHCNSDADIFSGETVSVPVHSGYEEIQDGEPITYGISPFEFDLAPEARGISDSPYARWQRKVRRTKLKRAYPKIEFQGSRELPTMLQAQEALNKKKGSTEGFSVLKTYWLSPDYYFDFASSQPYECLSGYEVKAETPLLELCPLGLRVDIENGRVVDMRPEVKEDCLSMSQFHYDPLSWEGKGLDDAFELQRWIDDIHTLYLQIQLREALGIPLYDKEMFSQGKFTGEVGMPVGVDVPNDGSGRTLEHAVKFISGNQPNQSIFAGMKYVQDSQVKVAGGFDAISGAGMEGSETARGRIIQREMGLQGQGVSLFLSARHDVIWAKQNLKLKKQYWTSERFVPYLEEGEPLGGRWFSASDLDTDFIVDVEADSWMPVTRMDAIDNLTTAAGGEAALQAVGGFAGILANPTLKPVHALARKGLELLNVPTGLDPEERDLRVARHRYSILKQAIERVVEQGNPSLPQDAGMDEKMNDESRDVPPELNSPLIVPPEQAMPFATLPSVRPLPDIDNHAVFVEFYKNAIKDAIDSDGIENHPLTKAALILLVKAHEAQGVFDMQEQGAMQLAATAPQQMTQQQQDGQQHQKEMEKSDQNQRHTLESQQQGSQLKQEEMKSKLQTNNGKSELDKVKV